MLVPLTINNPTGFYKIQDTISDPYVRIILRFINGNPKDAYWINNVQKFGYSSHFTIQVSERNINQLIDEKLEQLVTNDQVKELASGFREMLGSEIKTNAEAGRDLDKNLKQITSENSGDFFTTSQAKEIAKNFQDWLGSELKNRMDAGTHATLREMQRTIKSLYIVFLILALFEVWKLGQSFF